MIYNGCDHYIICIIGLTYYAGQQNCKTHWSVCISESDPMSQPLLHNASSISFLLSDTTWESVHACMHACLLYMHRERKVNEKVSVNKSLALPSNFSDIHFASSNFFAFFSENNSLFSLLFSSTLSVHSDIFYLLLSLSLIWLNSECKKRKSEFHLHLIVRLSPTSYFSFQNSTFLFKDIIK